MQSEKTLVIGLGNPILGDDGVGWVVAREVEDRLPQMDHPVEVDCLSLGGLSLMELTLLTLDSVRKARWLHSPWKSWLT
jgi:Ni,Fe-hydrogenase maturation factor